MALRLAGPMTGKIASASTFRSFLTETSIAVSTVGTIASLSCLSLRLRNIIASGSNWLTSSALMLGFSNRLCSLSSSLCSKPSSKLRSSASASPVAGSLFGVLFLTSCIEGSVIPQISRFTVNFTRANLLLLVQSHC